MVIKGKPPGRVAAVRPADVQPPHRGHLTPNPSHSRPTRALAPSRPRVEAVSRHSGAPPPSAERRRTARTSRPPGKCRILYVKYCHTKRAKSFKRSAHHLVDGKIADQLIHLRSRGVRRTHRALVTSAPEVHAYGVEDPPRTRIGSGRHARTVRRSDGFRRPCGREGRRRNHSSAATKRRAETRSGRRGCMRYPRPNQMSDTETPGVATVITLLTTD